LRDKEKERMLFEAGSERQSRAALCLLDFLSPTSGDVTIFARFFIEPRGMFHYILRSQEKFSEIITAQSKYLWYLHKRPGKR
jgi:hypothetical protein